MELDLTWILLGLPIAFALGWFASRLDLRQLRIENKRAPKAYFRGLNYLLTEQQDQAIDAFIEAVQNDPDTSELHFTLGNLFRRRGEYERAVRVHEHLMSRGDLNHAERNRAHHAIALDYLKAGLLDRAETALKKLEGTDYEEEARLALLSIYERSRDWQQASFITNKLNNTLHGSFNGRQAHYLCEQALASVTGGDARNGLKLLQQAQSTAPQSARPLIELAQLQNQLGQFDAALHSVQQLQSIAPQSLPLAARLLVHIAQHSTQRDAALQLLKINYGITASIDVLQAIVALDATGAKQWYTAHLERQPSLLAAAACLALEKNPEQALISKTLEHATKPLLRYHCAACGFEATQYFWNCPGCQAWDSYPARRIEEL